MKKTGIKLQNLSKLLLILCIFSACTEKELDPNDPAGSFVTAKEPYDDENFDHAIQRLGEFKSRFPYSRFTAQAELLIANSHFALEHFEEAASAYTQFVKLHPKNDQVEYAMYRIGESYWADAPEKIDRDQEYTTKAIEEWVKLIQRFPEGGYAQQARLKTEEGTRRLALAHEFVANFYCKQGMAHSCAYRFEELLEKYPQYPDLQRNALKKAAKAFDTLATLKNEDPESDKNLYFKRFKSSELQAKAQVMRSRLDQLK